MKRILKTSTPNMIIIMLKRQSYNDIKQIIVELHESMYDIMSEYVQRYSVMNEATRQKYLDYMYNLTREIKIYETAHKSKLLFLHTNRIKSML